MSVLQASVLEWMQRTLEVEFKEWFREEEPEMDHQGFFQSALPVIVVQVGAQHCGRPQAVVPLLLWWLVQQHAVLIVVLRYGRALLFPCVQCSLGRSLGQAVPRAPQKEPWPLTHLRSPLLCTDAE